MKLRFIIIFLIITTKLIAQPEYYGGEQGKKLDWVIHYFSEYYVDSLQVDSLAEIAILSMMAELDPFSVYQSSEQIKAQTEKDLGYSGKGIGMNYFVLNGEAIVTWILEASPADSVGIKKGDILKSVNNFSPVEKEKTFIQDLFDNDIDSILNITVIRDGAEKRLKVKKEYLPLYSILSSYMIDDNIGYIKQYNYTLKSPDEMKAALSNLQDKGMENLILDLRGNYGGVVQSAVTIADMFLSSDKLISYTDGFNHEKEEFFAGEENVFEKGKIVLLVDAFTMSAAELFTASLQDWDRALVVGIPTYGKGLVQQSYSLNDSSAVRLTIANYYTPTGRRIQKLEDYDKAWIASQKETLATNPFTSSLTVPSELVRKTKSGRKVIGGEGGVTPDLYSFVTDKKDKLSDHPDLYAFTTQYVKENKAEISGSYNNVSELLKDSSLDSDLSKNLIKFLAGGVELPTGTGSSFTSTIGSVTMSTIKSWMASQLWNDASYYQVLNQNDEVIQKAIECFQDNTFPQLKIKY